MYVGFTAQQLKHRLLQAGFAQNLYSLVGSNELPSKFCAYSYTIFRCGTRTTWTASSVLYCSVPTMHLVDTACRMHVSTTRVTREGYQMVSFLMKLFTRKDGARPALFLIFVLFYVLFVL